MAKQYYNLDFPRLAEMLLPTFLRSPKMTAWLKSTVEPLKTLSQTQQAFREDQRFKASHNSQVIYLEKALNQKYISGYSVTDHTGTREITIGPGEQLSSPYIFQRAELDPLYISGTTQVYTYTRAEIEAFYADFVVNVPATLTFDEKEMRAIIDYFVDTKTYKIKTY
jgi:hypothetical protein